MATEKPEAKGAGGKGFWDGGTKGHGNNRESGGKRSGLPGERTANRTGVRTDMEFPQTTGDAKK
jgi:hypothetical protein